MDEAVRRLEREAALGDPQAIARLERAAGLRQECHGKHQGPFAWRKGGQWGGLDFKVCCRCGASWEEFRLYFPRTYCLTFDTVSELTF